MDVARTRLLRGAAPQVAPFCVLARLSGRGGAGGADRRLGRLERGRAGARARSRASRSPASSPTIPSATSCSRSWPTATACGRWSCGSTRRAGPRRGRRRSSPRCGGSRREKPLVAELGEVAASGGYVAAIAADHIVGARQHADRLDRRDHGVSRPDAGDGAARHRARDGALVRAQGRAVAVPPDQPGGAGARRGAGGRELRLVPRPRRASGGDWAARRSTPWRTAASSPGGWRWRTG